MNTELDTAVAREVMKWRVLTLKETAEPIDIDYERTCYPCPSRGLLRYRRYPSREYEYYEFVPWQPSKDMNAAWEMEEAIPENCRARYYVELTKIVEVDTVNVSYGMFHFVHAAAEQRAQAAVAAMQPRDAA